MSVPTIHEVTARYLYGTASAPDNFFSNSLLTRGQLNSIQVDLADVYHPQTGLSRFANASQNVLVSTFFAARERWEAGHFDNDKVNGEIEWSQEDAIMELGLAPPSANIFVSKP